MANNYEEAEQAFIIAFNKISKGARGDKGDSSVLLAQADDSQTPLSATWLCRYNDLSEVFTPEEGSLYLLRIASTSGYSEGSIFYWDGTSYRVFGTALTTAEINNILV